MTTANGTFHSFRCWQTCKRLRPSLFVSCENPRFRQSYWPSAIRLRFWGQEMAVNRAAALAAAVIALAPISPIKKGGPKAAPIYWFTKLCILFSWVC